MPNETTGKFQKWLSTLPTVAYQLVIGLALAVITVLTVLAMMVVGRAAPEATLNSTYLFIAGLIGFGFGSYTAKRFSADEKIIEAETQRTLKLAGLPDSSATRTVTTKTETVRGDPVEVKTFIAKPLDPTPPGGE